MRKNANVRVDLFFLAALVLAGFLLFKNLGNVYFWEDEAETALLGRSILQRGYPSGFDGVNRLKPILGMYSDYWIYHPWLSFYCVAASFRFFGENTFTGRFPFALFGLGSIVLTYCLARKIYPEKRIAQVTSLLLVFSVPFLVLMRQCRYYAPTLFFSLWAMIAFLQFLKKERFSSTWLFFAAAALYFTNNGMWIPLIAVQLVYTLLFVRDREVTRRYLRVLLCNLLLAIPWFVLSQTWSLGAHPTMQHSWKNLEYYIRVINKFIIPLGFWILLFALLGCCQKLAKKKTAGVFLQGIGKNLRNGSSWLLVLWVTITLGFLIFVEQRHFRYLVAILPALLMLQAVLLEPLIGSRLKAIGVVILLALLLTNGLNSPQHFRSPILDYLYEITHDYDGPNEGIVLYLKEHAKPLDTVKLMYEDSPVMFYTGLKVDNRWYTEEETCPEWIIPRRPWAEEEFWNSEYYVKIQERYERIELNYSDIQWENREEPGGYNFETAKEAPKVIVFRRKDRS